MKRIKYVLLLCIMSIFMVMNVYADPDVLDQTEEISIEETSAEENPFFEDETEGTNELDMDSEEETGEEEYEEETDTLDETIVTLNFNVNFDFDTEEIPVYLVQVDIPLGLVNAEGSESHELINLLSSEGFTKTYMMNIYSDMIEMVAHVDGDNALLYNISFDGIDRNVLFGQEIRNSGIIRDVQNGQTYNVTLTVSENPDAKYKNANDVSEIPDSYKRIVSGEYGESRAAEIESAEATEETEEPIVPIEEDNGNGIVIIIIVVLVLMGIAAAVLYIRKLRSDDDD